MFSSEKEMSKLFERFIRVAFGNAYVKEFAGLFGIPDYIFYDKKNNRVDVVSFELKLANWRKATTQAFRHKSFANISYVVLDTHQAQAALKHLELFEQYNIGLAFFGKNREFFIAHKPKPEEPYSAHLYQKFSDSILKCRKRTRNFEWLTA
jgi:hypothetical protein